MDVIFAIRAGIFFVVAILLLIYSLLNWFRIFPQCGRQEDHQIMGRIICILEMTDNTHSFKKRRRAEKGSPHCVKLQIQSDRSVQTRLTAHNCPAIGSLGRPGRRSGVTA